MAEMPHDRLRKLLDAVLVGAPVRRGDMARRAHSSPHHSSRQIRRGAGESPVALRRRLSLERAAWRLRAGDGVTEVALGQGYASVEGFSRAFSRAFGFRPSAAAAGGARWLPAPNGIHFHPPTSAWVEAGPASRAGADPSRLKVLHDVDDARALLGFASPLPPGDLARPLAPLTARHEAVAPRWLGAVRRIGDEGRLDDVLIDVLCDPPESFVLGTVAHVLTCSAHRRQEALMLRLLGVDPGDGDPIMWARERGDAS